VGDKACREQAEPQVYDLKRWDRVWLTITGKESKTIYVQVPPSPAKLILRDVVDDVDVAVSADYVYPLITATPRDNNVGVDDKWGEEDGILSYGRWYTESDGYIKSFKALGTADPRYGSIVLPIAGWLNDTFHDGVPATKDEFHYQINIVWKSAVVYSDNIVLTKQDTNRSKRSLHSNILPSIKQQHQSTSQGTECMDILPERNRMAFSSRTMEDSTTNTTRLRSMRRQCIPMRATCNTCKRSMG